MAVNEHRTTARVLEILELLAANIQGLTLTEIAEIIDAPKSSILPLIHTMAHRKFIFLNEKTYKYNIGINAFCTGAAFTSNTTALDFVKTEMEIIMKQTGEICQMGVLEGGQVLYIAKVDSDNPIRIISYVGKRLPAYCTALGKAMLCKKSLEELKEIYPNGLVPFTSNTITDFEVLKEQLDKIKTTSLAVEHGEVNEETDCISVPLSHGDNIIAAISVNVPTFRMTEEKASLIKTLLFQSKVKIETFFRERGVDNSQFIIKY